MLIQIGGLVVELGLGGFYLKVPGCGEVALNSLGFCANRIG